MTFVQASPREKAGEQKVIAKSPSQDGKGPPSPINATKPAAPVPIGSSFRLPASPAQTISKADQAAHSSRMRAIAPLDHAALESSSGVDDAALQLEPLGPGAGIVQASCETSCECARCAEQKGIVQRSGNGRSPASAGDTLARLGSGSALPAALARTMGPSFGRELSSVTIHPESSVASELGARAFAVKNHVAFAPGEYRPDSAAGRRLIAHELAHVVQQSGGAGSVQGAGLDYDGYEREADLAADVVVRGGAVQRLTPIRGELSIQRQPAPDAKASEAKKEAPAPQPGADTVQFEGILLSTSPEHVRHQLEQYVASKGFNETIYFKNRFVLFTLVASPAYDKHGLLPASEWDLRKTILKIIVEQLAAIHADNLIFLAEFEQLGLFTVRDLLGASEERTKEAAKVYGLTEEQITVTRDTGREKGQVWVREQKSVHHMADSPTTQDLKTAAAMLVAKLDEIAALRAKQQTYVEHLSKKCGNEICDYDRITDPTAYHDLGRRIRAGEHQYEILRAAKERDHPILAAYNEQRSRLRTIAAGPSDASAATLGGVIADRLSNIDRVHKGLKSGDVKVWKLPSIVAIAQAKMHIAPGSMKARVVADKIKEVEADEFWTNLGISAIAIGLALVAAIPSGGSSLLAAGSVIAGVGGAVLSGYVAYEHYQEYTLAAAQAGSDFDRARAISQEDPSMFWLALDIVAAVFDIGAAAAAFKTFAKSARAAARGKTVGNVAEDATITALRQEGNAFKPGLGDKLADHAIYARELHESGTLKSVAKSAEELAEEGTLAARTVGGGHELKGVRGGKAVICSFPCDFLANRYKHELDANPGWKSRLDKLESEMGAAEAAGKTADVDKIFDELAKLEDEMRVEHQQRLGYDLESKKFRPHEAKAAESIENMIGAPLSRLDPKLHPTKTGDWIDPMGRTWDAVGPIPTAHFNLGAVTAQIDAHMLKTALDFVFVDLKGLTSAQRLDVLKHLNSLPRRAKPIIKVGT